MCFTIKITADALKLENRFGVPAKNLPEPKRNQVRGFDHPVLPIVLENAIVPCRWGLIPSWVKTREEALEMQNKTLNARSETAMEKASFRQAVLSRRCIVPVDSFFETQHRGKTKVPFEIFPTQDEFLALAGIWETWISPQTQTPVSGFSILTCQANELMAEIHNTKLRMPVVIHPDQIKTWLNPNLSHYKIDQLTQPYPVSWLRAESELNMLF